MEDYKPLNIEKTESVLYEILEERKNQHDKWGEQNHPIIYGDQKNIDRINRLYFDKAEAQKYSNNKPDLDHPISWLEIIAEEFCEIFAESDFKKQRAELVQMVAVGVQMIENIDRRLRDAEQ
jgi:hypothetical protein